MIGETVSHYKILEKLGEGGMGVVYKAHDITLDRDVAIKFLPPQLQSDKRAKTRFVHEAKAASALNHSNIAVIHEIDETPDGQMFIVMAYYDGQTLKDKLEDGPLSIDDAVDFVFQIASGLAVAHEKDILHRDIKPANILITERGEAKLADFGLAKLRGQTRLTKPGTTVGTVFYMSPEQAKGEEVSSQSDVFSLGVVLYELLTGEVPFKGDHEAAVLYGIINSDPESLTTYRSDIPEAVQRIVQTALEKNTDKRYRSAAEFLADLQGLRGGILTTDDGSEGFGARRTIMTTATAIITVAIVVSALWFFAGDKSVFTTKVRLAVMQLDNKTHPTQGRFVTGLTDIVSDMFDYASRQHESMWVVPNRLVRYAKLADDADAKDSFGVNRIVTGNVQRYEDRELLFLELRNAATLEQIRTASVIFDAESPVALADSLPAAILYLLSQDPNVTSNLDFFLPREAKAIKPYIEGVGAALERDVDAALESLESACSKDSLFAAGHGALGWAYWKQYGNSDDEDLLTRSIQQLEVAAALEPRLWRARVSLGQINRAIDSVDVAIDWFRTVVDKDPGNPLACRRLARVFEGQNRLDEAERTHQAAIDRHPDYFESHRSRALFFYRVGEEDKAMSIAQWVLSLASSDAFTINLRGALHYNRGEYAVAGKLFERAFQLLPTCETCANIGLMLYYERDYKNSASYYELALEYCDLEDHQNWANWASTLYWVEGEREHAIEVFNKAISLVTDKLQKTPDEPLLIGSLVEYYAMIGDETNARQMIERAEPFMDSEPELMFAIADAYEIFGDRVRALRYIGDALRHGFPIERVEATRELFDLVEDPRYKRMILERDDLDPTGSEASN